MPKSEKEILRSKLYHIYKTGAIIFDEKLNPYLDETIKKDDKLFYKYLQGATPLTNLYFYLTTKQQINYKRPDLLKAGPAWLEFRKQFLKSNRSYPLPTALQKELKDEIKELNAENFWEIKDGELKRTTIQVKHREAKSSTNGHNVSKTKLTSLYSGAHARGLIKFQEGTPYYRLEYLGNEDHTQQYETYIAGHTPLTASYFYLLNCFKKSKKPCGVKFVSAHLKNYFADCLAKQEWLPLSPELKSEIETQIEPYKNYWMFTDKGLLKRKPQFSKSLAPSSKTYSTSKRKPVIEGSFDSHKRQRHEATPSSTAIFSPDFNFTPVASVGSASPSVASLTDADHTWLGEMNADSKAYTPEDLTPSIAPTPRLPQASPSSSSSKEVVSSDPDNLGSQEIIQPGTLTDENANLELSLPQLRSLSHPHHSLSLSSTLLASGWEDAENLQIPAVSTPQSPSPPQAGLSVSSPLGAQWEDEEFLGLPAISMVDLPSSPRTSSFIRMPSHSSSAAVLSETLAVNPDTIPAASSSAVLLPDAATSSSSSSIAVSTESADAAPLNEAHDLASSDDAQAADAASTHPFLLPDAATSSSSSSSVISSASTDTAPLPVLPDVVINADTGDINSAARLAFFNSPHVLRNLLSSNMMFFPHIPAQTHGNIFGTAPFFMGNHAHHNHEVLAALNYLANPLGMFR